jgi:dipeptidyl-peptidase 4
MKIFSLTLALAFYFHSAILGLAQKQDPLTLEAIFKGSLREAEPSEMRWAPDGRRLGFFLPEGKGEKSLWVHDLLTGERIQAVSSREVREMAPSPEQALINERERTRRTRYGVPSYLWAPDGNHILFTSAAQLRLYDLAAHQTILLAPSKKGPINPKFSPDGKWISFIFENDIWIVPGTGGNEKQVTFGGSKRMLHGEPDWIYQEELDVRTGYSWSPDSQRIAFMELDERKVPVYPIIEQSSGQPAVYTQSYPKSGDPSPAVRIGITNLKNRKMIWIDRSAEYIPRIDWADRNALIVQLLNRAQTELELIEVNPATGRSLHLLSEKDRYWLNITDDLTFVSGGTQFLWTSERSGFRHIYLFSRSGQLVRQLTAGDWVVSDIAGVDERNGWIYYNSNQASILGRDLFRIRMDGSGTERVTRRPGTHKINLNASATALVDAFSSKIQAPEISVCSLAEGKETELFRSGGMSEYALAVPEIKELSTPDGAVVRVTLLKPRDLEPGHKYPLVVYIYGMPGVPAIQDTWEGKRGLFHQFLVQQGFLVAQIDDRSSAVPGHKYEIAAYHNLGRIAAKDHELALHYLKSLPFVDGDASAVWGWSGGGFMAAYHMTHTDLFKAGIAVAPVTDWRLYDSIYTERYMGLPDKESEAYDRASVIKATAQYRGHLLLVHGTEDDNVHPQNTIQFVHELIQKNKQFDLMLYPGKTHSISGSAESLHLYTTIYRFLERYLR